MSQAHPTPDREIGKHHPDDLEWIREQIGKLPQYAHRGAYKGYGDRFTAAREAEPTPHKKTNKARYAANRWLALYVSQNMKGDLSQ